MPNLDTKMQIISLDPSPRQTNQDIFSYSYSRDVFDDRRVVVLDAGQEPIEYILANSEDLGCFEFTDGSSYLFLRMYDYQSLFLAQLTGLCLDKQSILSRFDLAI